jgi:hypothetical protein
MYPERGFTERLGTEQIWRTPHCKGLRAGEGCDLTLSVSSLLRKVVCSPQSSLLVLAVVHAQPVTRAEHDNSGWHLAGKKSSVMPLQSTIKQLLKGGKPILCSQQHMLPNMTHNNPSSYPEQMRTGQACYNRHA